MMEKEETKKDMYNIKAEVCCTVGPTLKKSFLQTPYPCKRPVAPRLVPGAPRHSFTVQRLSIAGRCHFSLQNIHRSLQTEGFRHVLVTRWLAQHFVPFHSLPFSFVLPPSSSPLPTQVNTIELLSVNTCNHGYQWHKSPSREEDVYIGAHLRPARTGTSPSSLPIHSLRSEHATAMLYWTARVSRVVKLTGPKVRAQGTMLELI